MSVSKFRGILYTVAKYLGDWQAISSGDPKKIERRIKRRVAGKLFGREVMRRL